MRVRLLERIDDIEATQWDSLVGTDNPFLKHAFLSALEGTGCVAESEGWLPQHLVLLDERGALAGAMPLYLKEHSWGEFVFDWAWADAYQRAGLAYYPKLVSAIPYTPATGSRLLTADTTDRGAVRTHLIRATLDLARELNVSSCHVLFPQEDELALLRDHGFLARKDCQFHWRRGSNEDFEGFLGGFSSKKRKNVRRERRRIAELGIEFETLKGGEIDPCLWDTIYHLHASTFAMRGRRPYLTRRFFETIDRTMPEHLMIKVARHHDRAVGAAIFFEGAQALYGRYWGCAVDIHSLHFETCYYQGIDYCLENGLDLFEPGTQGEHKISRGFTPATTWSAHWLANPHFSRAIEDFLVREQGHVESYMTAVDEHSPFRAGLQQHE